MHSSSCRRYFGVPLDVSTNLDEDAVDEQDGEELIPNAV